MATLTVLDRVRQMPHRVGQEESGDMATSRELYHGDPFSIISYNAVNQFLGANPDGSPEPCTKLTTKALNKT